MSVSQKYTDCATWLSESFFKFVIVIDSGDVFYGFSNIKLKRPLCSVKQNHIPTKSIMGSICVILFSS